MSESTKIKDLQAVMTRLRDPKAGCPWDLEQNFKSIAPYTIEEAYEVADAIERGDINDLKDELGDLLFQIIFLSHLASEQNLFDFDAVTEHVTAKMIARHPHVFGDRDDIKNTIQVNELWDEVKAKEGKKSGYLLDEVTRALPALLRAQKLQKKAAKVGFDWPSTEEVFAKIEEEKIELNQAIQKGISNEIEDELGDLLFCMVNLARKLGVDAEQALTKTNIKFYNRFNIIEDEIKVRNKDFSDYNLEELDALWTIAKERLRKNKPPASALSA
jgi:ATP diphosphatase